MDMSIFLYKVELSTGKGNPQVSKGAKNALCCCTGLSGP